jgi:predicted metal-dependent HD superfamily phosphohydrolase
MCDADLAVLAGSPEAYAAYVDDVREEYASVPDEEFWAARYDVLEPWVEGEIYRTGKGKLLTPAARANVIAELTRLAELLGIEPPEAARG